MSEIRCYCRNNEVSSGYGTPGGAPRSGVIPTAEGGTPRGGEGEAGGGLSQRPRGVRPNTCVGCCMSGIER